MKVYREKSVFFGGVSMVRIELLPQDDSSLEKFYWLCLTGRQ